MKSRLLLAACASVFSACATTAINFRGERMLSHLGGTLDVARTHEKARIEVDQQPALALQKSEHSTLIELIDDERQPNARLFIAIEDAQLVPNATLRDGEFIPYVEVRTAFTDASGDAHAFLALCKGGRGGVHLERANEDAISGQLAIIVSCRTYVDGYEREEGVLDLRGPFSAAR